MVVVVLGTELHRTSRQGHGVVADGQGLKTEGEGDVTGRIVARGNPMVLVATRPLGPLGESREADVEYVWLGL